MKFISFKKYKAYLESIGYKQEKGENIYYGLGFRSIFFSKDGNEDKYMTNVFLDSDSIMSINYGHGSIYVGWNAVNVDMRKKFWKDLTI